MTKKQIALVTLGAAVALIGIGTGSFFIIRHVSDEKHKNDIEMAADCARTFEAPKIEANWDSSRGGFINTGAYETLRNNRNNKRQECVEKYHVTHQEIIDKIGSEDYQPF